jgi:hypothetical protein
VLASRRDHRLVFTDDPTSSVELSLGDAKCLLHLEKSESTLQGERKLVITADTIQITAKQKLSLEGQQVEITAKSDVTVSGQPIRLN